MPPIRALALTGTEAESAREEEMAVAISQFLYSILCNQLNKSWKPSRDLHIITLNCVFRSIIFEACLAANECQNVQKTCKEERPSRTL